MKKMDRLVVLVVLAGIANFQYGLEYMIGGMFGVFIINEVYEWVKNKNQQKPQSL
jgi:uncharacterized membrane protein